MCLATVADSQGRTTLEKLAPSETQLFSGNLVGVIQAMKCRREVQGGFGEPSLLLPQRPSALS